MFIGWQARDGKPDVIRYQFEGERSAVRRATVLAALVGLRERVDAG